MFLDNDTVVVAGVEAMTHTDNATTTAGLATASHWATEGGKGETFVSLNAALMQVIASASSILYLGEWDVRLVPRHSRHPHTAAPLHLGVGWVSPGTSLSMHTDVLVPLNAALMQIYMDTYGTEHAAFAAFAVGKPAMADL